MTSAGKYVAQSRATLSTEGLQASPARLYEPGVVLYAMYASLGESSIAVGSVSSSQAILGICPTNELDAEFLYYYLQSIGPKVKKMGQQGTQANLNAGMVRDFRLRLPDINEQLRIAAVLSRADEFVSLLELLVVKKQAIKQGMMQQFLTGKTRLPGFSEPWKEVRLGDHVNYLRNVALSRAQLDDASPLRYLHYGDIHGSRAVTLAAATTQMPRANALLGGSATILQVGDLVFADASEDPAGVGKSVEICSVPTDGVVPGLHTIAARFDKNYLADGFKAYLQFHPVFRASLLRLAAGTKVLATTRSYISSVSLALPGVAEQRAIAEVLWDAGAEIEGLEQRLVKVRAIKQGVMQELLTGRTRLPVEESAA